MLTIFSTPKPFRGHIGIIQRNALESWKRIHPDVEIILFGNEDGAAQTARTLGIRQVPDVERNEHGTKYLTSIFDQAQDIARHPTLCYVNCDIVLMSDFRRALAQVSAQFPRFLMVSRRWDTDVTEPLDFQNTEWESRLGRRALETNHQRPPEWIDYFAFSRGLYLRNTPPFVIGRPGWDNWLLWKARAAGASVVDASKIVLAVHQNHDYSYHPDGEIGVWKGEEAQKNYALLDGRQRFRTIEDAPLRLTATDIQPNRFYWLAPTKRRVRKVRDHVQSFARTTIWHPLLDATRPLRHAIGLKQESFRAMSRSRKRRQWID
jgi:hypothetical protein